MKGYIILLLAFVSMTAVALALSAQDKKVTALKKSAINSALQSKLEKIKSEFGGQIGVHVVDPELGPLASVDADRLWYLASTTKVFVATEVLRQIERGQLRFEDKVTLKTTDYRDGAGQTNYHKPGVQLSIRYLLEQMLIESDNAATDILINRVGATNVQRTVNEEIPQGFGPITTLLDVRKLAFGELHPDAHRLGADDFMALKKDGRNLSKKMALFSKLIGIPASQFRFRSVVAAYESYYTKGFNSGTLVAYSEVLARIARRKWVSTFVSSELYKLMSRCQTGKDRIKAGFPAGYKFAHKTGTQLGRICDMGILTTPNNKTLTIAACAHSYRKDKQAATALMNIGKAIAAHY